MPKTPLVRTCLPPELILDFQKGIMSFTYKGIQTWKCPFDLAIYAELLWDLRPRTILEFGSNAGGSALWMADTLTSMGLQATRILSFDIQPVLGLHDPRIEFRHCDCSSPAETLTPGFLSSLAHPVLVIDDASHVASHVTALLECVHPFLLPGDYVIVEDAIISHMGEAAVRQFEGGPAVAIAGFLAAHGDAYEIDRPRCDRFGLNATWNVDGYLKRVG